MKIVKGRLEVANSKANRDLIVRAVNEHAALVSVSVQFDAVLVQLEAAGMIVPPNCRKAQATLAAIRASESD